MTHLFVNGALLLGGTLAGGWLCRSALERRQQEWEARLRVEREAERRRRLALVGMLAYAVEATHSYSAQNLDGVLRIASILAENLGLPGSEAAEVQMAALLHNIGRLGVPEHILHKTEALTQEEQAALRLHPVFGAQLLASLPLGGQAAALVRHHTERWDGSGYPDGLAGDAIPQGARILAVANAFCALIHPRPFRAAHSLEEAFASIEEQAGNGFEPRVVAALRAAQADIEAALSREPPSGASSSDLPLLASLPAEARAALEQIAAAQRETLGMSALTRSLNESLHIEAVAHTLLSCTQMMIPCGACVLFLPEEGGEFLRARAAVGLNSRHLLGSLARAGAYLTGRAFSRREITQATFLHSDLMLRAVSDTWVPFRSTLIVPLTSGSEALGTLNLYAEEPDAFGPETQRVLRLIASQGSRALNNALRFAAVQETATTDALTGLRNARYLREYLDREINRARREETPLVVLNIDLDNFKPINDQFGHARGDQTLREVAEILHTHVRNYDLAARYAGDEFVVVLSRAGRIQAEAAALKLKQAVERHSGALVAAEPDFPRLGISIGIALFPEDAEDVPGLLCRSDAAMYADKQERRAGRASAGNDQQDAWPKATETGVFNPR